MFRKRIMSEAFTVCGDYSGNSATPVLSHSIYDHVFYTTTGSRNEWDNGLRRILQARLIPQIDFTTDMLPCICHTLRSVFRRMKRAVALFSLIMSYGLRLYHEAGPGNHSTVLRTEA
jgi:hypothetical protein